MKIQLLPLLVMPALLLTVGVVSLLQKSTVRSVSSRRCNAQGAITSKIKHAIKRKTSPARLAQLLQPSLAFLL